MTQKTSRFFSITLGVLVCCVGAMWLQSAQANQFKRIRDVNVSCNNALRCDMYISNPRVTLHSFGFRRSAAPDAPLELVLGSRDALRMGSEIIFSIDDDVLFSKPLSAFSYRPATYEYTYRVSDDVNLLLANARRGAVAQVSYVTKSGASTAPFSLSGIVAGSIFMDEVQGRIGKSDALTNIGTPSVVSGVVKPDTEFVEIGQWSELPRGLNAFYGNEDRRCDNKFGDTQFNAPLAAFKFKLNNKKSVIAANCGSPGAYNISYAFWVLAGDDLLPLDLPIIADEGPSTTPYAFNISWNVENNELVAFYKGRGLGDCGSYNRWKLDAETVAFVLFEAKRKDDCDGVYKDDFSDYQQLWP